MVELEHLDETCNEIVKWIGTRKWNTSLCVQQNHKIKTFVMGETILLFPKGRKEHTKKFKKPWFGSYKIQYSLLNDTIPFVNIDKFEPNPILVNINKSKPYKYLGKALRGLKVTIEGGRKHMEDS
jgi:hypothetical protein